MSGLAKVNNRKSLTAPANAVTTPQAVEVAHDGKQIYRKGVLIRQTDILKKWKECYFVLREDKLTYYNNEEEFQKNPKKVCQTTFEY